MYAFKLIQLIEARAEPLSDGLMRRIKKDDRCAELLRRVSQDELRRRSHEIYFNLNDWLRNKTVSEIEDTYIGLGMRRAKQGVPYTDLLWAVSATKEHLWEFMETEGIFTEPIDMLGGMDLPPHIVESVSTQQPYATGLKPAYAGAHEMACLNDRHSRRHSCLAVPHGLV
jgi:hypothetical protein